MLQYLHGSMAGTYYVVCKLISQDGSSYRIRFIDPISDEETDIITTKDRLRGVLPTGTVHKVKSWSHFYDAIVMGTKTHELRHDDRNYQVGDKMLLQKFDNIQGKYTGDECLVEITYITNRNKPCAFSGSVLQRDYCILSIRLIE
jgi:hypothetical protein